MKCDLLQFTHLNLAICKAQELSETDGVALLSYTGNGFVVMHNLEGEFTFSGNDTLFHLGQVISNEDLDPVTTFPDDYYLGE